MVEKAAELAILSSCFQCPEEQTVSAFNRTVDHIVPWYAKKLYPAVVGSLMRKKYNHAIVCRSHHKDIDDAKIAAVRDLGLLGLVCFLIVEYPDGRDEVKESKRKQFINLFESTRDSIKRAPREKIPPEVVRTLPTVIQTLEMGIDTYKSGSLIVPGLVMPTREQIKKLRAA